MEASVRKQGGKISSICALEGLCGEGGSLQSSGSPRAHLN